jgi:hypothetical protein
MTVRWAGVKLDKTLTDCSTFLKRVIALTQRCGAIAVLRTQCLLLLLHLLLSYNYRQMRSNSDWYTHLARCGLRALSLYITLIV